jgi:hypothetical protein
LQSTKTSRWTNPLCEISNLLSRAECNSSERPTRTLLFRQHRAALDFESVYHWIKLLVHLIRFSHECGPAGLPLSLLLKADEERRTQAGKFDTISFMSAVGAKSSAEFYRGRLYAHESEPYFNNFKDGSKSDDISEFPWETDSSHSTFEDTDMIFTPPDSSSSISSCSEDAISYIEGSLSPCPGSPMLPTLCAPPESDLDLDWDLCEDERPPTLSHGLETSADKSEWSHIVELLAPFSNDDDGCGYSSCNQCSRDPRLRVPNFENLDEPIISMRKDPTYDLTHRDIQY